MSALREYAGRFDSLGANEPLLVSRDEMEAAWESPVPGKTPWQIHPNIGDYYRETRCGGKPKEERKRLRARRDLAVRDLPLRDA